MARVRNTIVATIVTFDDADKCLAFFRSDTDNPELTVEQAAELAGPDMRESFHDLLHNVLIGLVGLQPSEFALDVSAEAAEVVDDEG